MSEIGPPAVPDVNLILTDMGANMTFNARSSHGIRVNFTRLLYNLLHSKTG